jgi:endonuclease YncB( thermonuclease family)
MNHGLGWGWLVVLGAIGCASSGRDLTFAQARSDQYHRLVGVVSGDTIVVRMAEWNGRGEREVNVRLIGVQCPIVDPEQARFGAVRAQSAVAAQLAREWVRLEFNNDENRPLVHYDGSLVADQECYVFVPPPGSDPGGHEEFLNEWLLDEGHGVRDHGIAEADRGILGQYKRRLDLAGERARRSRRGVWTITHP